MRINECKSEHEETLEHGLRKTPVEIRVAKPASARLRGARITKPLILESRIEKVSGRAL